MPDTNNTASAFQLLLTPEKAAIATGQATTLRVLARIQAPLPPAGSVPRQPLHLALVLDRSGSMNGIPLEEAKRCARNIIDSLADGDRAAIFAFDDEIVQVAPLTPAANKLALATALATIESGGCTNLHGGWRGTVPAGGNGAWMRASTRSVVVCPAAMAALSGVSSSWNVEAVLLFSGMTGSLSGVRFARRLPIIGVQSLMR